MLDRGDDFRTHEQYTRSKSSLGHDLIIVAGKIRYMSLVDLTFGCFQSGCIHDAICKFRDECLRPCISSSKKDSSRTFELLHFWQRRPYEANKETLRQDVPPKIRSIDDQFDSERHIKGRISSSDPRLTACIRHNCSQLQNEYPGQVAGDNPGIFRTASSRGIEGGGVVGRNDSGRPIAVQRWVRARSDSLCESCLTTRLRT